MQKARLLHSNEVVEVLSVDLEKNKAHVRRHGFERVIALDELVFEEPWLPAAFVHAPLSPSPDRRQETEVWLSIPTSPARVQIEIRHGLDAPACYALWIAQGSTWHHLSHFLAAPQEAYSVEVSTQAYALPWRLAVQRLLLPAQSGTLPELMLWHFTVDKSRLSIRTPQKLQPETTPPSVAPKPPLAAPPTPPPLPDFSEGNPPDTLDLHIERLAPELKKATPEAILDYQLITLQRYLRACESRRYLSVIVIHGIGDMKLYREIEKICKSCGWSLEKLPGPPYLNGASRVYFWGRGDFSKK